MNHTHGNGHVAVDDSEGRLRQTKKIIATWHHGAFGGKEQSKLYIMNFVS